MRVERVTANIGAIVHGFDVHDRYGAEVATTLQCWLHEHGVLLFHADEQIEDDDYCALGSLFGEVYVYPYNDEVPRADPRIAPIGGDDVVRAGRYRERIPSSYWHTDGTAQGAPPQAALLTPTTLPSVGGDTMWASTTAAFEALSSRLQRMLDGLEALHSTDPFLRRYVSAADHRAVFGDGHSCIHPVVITDPVTQRKVLYVNSNFTERIVGMTESESRRLLDMLFEHVNTPEFHMRLRWQPTTIAVWEERVTQHRAVADYDEPRLLRRITIRGDPLAA